VAGQISGRIAEEFSQKGAEKGPNFETALLPLLSLNE
jgi:hypothetical protein